MPVEPAAGAVVVVVVEGAGPDVAVVGALRGALLPQFFAAAAGPARAETARTTRMRATFFIERAYWSVGSRSRRS